MNFAYEFKKIIFSKISICVMLICLGLNGYIAYVRTKAPDARKYDDYIDAKVKLYKQLEGEITEDKINYITYNYKILEEKFISQSLSHDYDPNTLSGYESTDYLLFSEVYKKLSYELGYSDRMVSIRDMARENVLFYRKQGAKDVEDYNTRIYASYSDRKLENFYRTDQWNYYFTYSFSNLMIILTMVIMLSGIFCNERENGMSALILTSKSGKVKTYINKVLVALLVSVCVTAVFCVEDLAVFTYGCDLKGFSEPLYSVEEMAYTIYDISIIQYIFMMAGIKCIGMMAIAMIILTASAISGNSLSGIVTSIVCIIPFIVINEFRLPANIVRLLQISEDASTMSIANIFGNIVSYIEYNIITSLMLVALLLIISYLIENVSCKVLGKERI